MKIRGRAVAKKVALGANRVAGPTLRRVGLDTKGLYEYAFWKSRKLEEKTLGNDFYEVMFTEAVGLSRDDYRGKRVLDVGCGPRGSLEWCSDAAERVGLDSLVGRYRKLGIDEHSMVYVESGAESIPFGDGHFDIVSAFNSLDHVDDLRQSFDEMCRVVTAGGMLIIVVDIHRRPTVAEPHAVPWDLAGWLPQDFEVEYERHLEKPRGHDYLVEQIPFDHSNPEERYGSLVLRARRG